MYYFTVSILKCLQQCNKPACEFTITVCTLYNCTVYNVYVTLTLRVQGLTLKQVALCALMITELRINDTVDTYIR